jgi:uncharacterized protein (PEP-CTERM system associated)
MSCRSSQPAAAICRWVGLCLALAPSPPAAAETPSPEQVRLAPFLPGFDAFDLLPDAPDNAPASPPSGWRITPSAGLQLLATDNAHSSPNDKRSELITTITPGLAVAAETARLTGRLSYSPNLVFYAGAPDQNRVDQRFSGNASAALLQDKLFLDVLGFGGVQVTRGGTAPQGAPAVDRNNRIQTVSLQASPYYLHRFGGLATARVGYTWRYLTQDGNDAFLPGSSQPFFTSQETTAHEGYAVVRTGEDFGRLALEGRASAVTYDSNGVLDGAHRNLATLQALYALTREVSVAVEGGYEDTHYGGTRPFNEQGAVWSAGARLAPNSDSVITVTYGRRGGYEAPYVDASTNIGVRTRVFASYTDKIGTVAQTGAELLAAATVDSLGNPVVSSTTPTYLPFGGSLLASQTSVQRLKRGVLGISQSWPRDNVSLTLSYDDRSPVTATRGTESFPQKGYSVGLAWSHALTETLNGISSLQYGRTRSSSSLVGNGDFYSVRLGVTQQLRPGLFGTLQYILTSQSANLASGDAMQNVVIFGIQQVF